MNQHQLADLINNPTQEVHLLLVDELANKTDRTLLFGYNTDRQTIHVYLKGGVFHTFIYCPSGTDGEAREIIRYHSDKEIDLMDSFIMGLVRYYPHACDYSFCKLMLRHGITLPLATYEISRGFQERQYYGRLFQNPAVHNCKACGHETVTADETGLCAPCRVVKTSLRKMLQEKI